MGSVISSIFGGGERPSAPPPPPAPLAPPPPPPPAPTIDNSAEVAATEAAERKQRGLAQGRTSTDKTLGLVDEEASVAKRYLGS